MKIAEPAIDLPVALAIASAYADKPLPPGTMAIGELGLGGEVDIGPLFHVAALQVFLLTVGTGGTFVTDVYVDGDRALAERWELFSAPLHHHHTGEDTWLWPFLMERATAETFSEWVSRLCTTVPAPACGMVFTLMSVPPMKDIAATHQLCPTPAVDMLILPGFAFAYWIASWIVLSGTLLLAEATTIGKYVA